MKNSELLAYTGSERLLSQIDGQRRHVLRVEQGPFQCPNCGTEHAKWEIHGITDIDDYNLSENHGDDGKCRACDRELRYVVYLIGGESSLELVPDPELAR